MIKKSINNVKKPIHEAVKGLGTAVRQPVKALQPNPASLNTQPTKATLVRMIGLGGVVVAVLLIMWAVSSSGEDTKKTTKKTTGKCGDEPTGKMYKTNKTKDTPWSGTNDCFQDIPKGNKCDKPASGKKFKSKLNKNSLYRKNKDSECFENKATTTTGICGDEPAGEMYKTNKTKITPWSGTNDCFQDIPTGNKCGPLISGKKFKSGFNENSLYRKDKDSECFENKGLTAEQKAAKDKAARTNSQEQKKCNLDTFFQTNPTLIKKIKVVQNDFSLDSIKQSDTFLKDTLHWDLNWKKFKSLTKDLNEIKTGDICEDGYSVPTSFTCSAGNWTPEATACKQTKAKVTSCPAGQYFTAAQGGAAAKCTACAKDTFSATPDKSTKCEPNNNIKVCPAGQYFTAGTSTAAAKCTACSDGTFNAKNDKSTKCDPNDKINKCPAGQYFTAGTNKAAAKCTACADGTFNAKNDKSTKCEGYTKCTKTGVKTEGDKTKDVVCNKKQVNQCNAESFFKSSPGAWTNTPRGGGRKVRYVDLHWKVIKNKIISPDNINKIIINNTISSDDICEDGYFVPSPFKCNNGKWTPSAKPCKKKPTLEDCPTYITQHKYCKDNKCYKEGANWYCGTCSDPYKNIWDGNKGKDWCPDKYKAHESGEDGGGNPDTQKDGLGRKWLDSPSHYSTNKGKPYVSKKIKGYVMDKQVCVHNTDAKDPGYANIFSKEPWALIPMCPA